MSDVMIKYSLLTMYAILIQWIVLLGHQFTVRYIVDIGNTSICVCILLMTVTHNQWYLMLCGCCHSKLMQYDVITKMNSFTKNNNVNIHTLKITQKL